MSSTPSLPSSLSLAERIQRAYELADSASYSSAFEYLRHVVINCKPSPSRFITVAKPWQIAMAQRVLPAVESIAGLRHDYFGPTSFWFTLPRGHDKTGAIARAVNWALAYTRLSINCLAASGDREQANILLQSMQEEARLNPWLGQRLHFKNYEVTGAQGSFMRALSSDGYSSFGFRPDLMVFDELTHWKDNELWKSLMSGREKRRGSVLLIISNAGFKDTWQYEVLQTVRQDPSWFVYDCPGRLDTWMDEAATQRMALLLPPSEARRVLNNEWIDLGDDMSLVRAEEVRACADLGKARRLIYCCEGVSGIKYVAAIDYGPVKDRTVCVVLHQDKDGTIVVDKMDVMEGKNFPGGRVLIESVERWIDDVRKSFRIECFVVDRYQMDSTIQRFTGLVNLEPFEARGGKANYELASNLRALIVNTQVTWYPGCGLLVDKSQNKAHCLDDELKEVLIRQMGYGFRIDHLSGRHDDRVVALGMAALYAVQRGKKLTIPDDLTCYF